MASRRTLQLHLAGDNAAEDPAEGSTLFLDDLDGANGGEARLSLMDHWFIRPGMLNLERAEEQNHVPLSEGD